MEQFEQNIKPDVEIAREHLAREIEIAQQNKSKEKEYDANLIGINETMLTPEELGLYEKVQSAALLSATDRELTLEEICRLEQKLCKENIPGADKLDDEQKKQKLFELIKERINDTHGNFLAMLKNRLINIQVKEKLEELRRRKLH